MNPELKENIAYLKYAFQQLSHFRLRSYVKLIKIEHLSQCYLYEVNMLGVGIQSVALQSYLN